MRGARGKRPKSPKTANRILVIEDEKDMQANYVRMLNRAGYEVLAMDDPRDLEKKIQSFRPDVVVSDMMMPHGTGMDVLDRVQRQDALLPVIIITAFGSIESAVEAMRKRAADYLTKPFSIDDLLKKIQVLVSQRLIESQAAGGSITSEAETGWREKIVGISPALEKVLDLTRKVARTDVNVLIVGESGSGKEVFARTIHRLSPRRDEIFVPVDCASLPENLLESELFGYRKGAFTGANSDKMGLFEFSHKGTLFLDEIGEMPLSLQAKLLRVLQERQFRPIGGREQIEIDVRVIAATNRDLEQALVEKTFRSDLYYRLNVVTLRIPSLAERRADVPLLADHFLMQFARDNRLTVEGISHEALECLKAYAWPGNVRELQNVIERAATLAGGPIIQPEDLPSRIGSNVATSGNEVEDNGLFSKKNEVVQGFERDYLVSLLMEHNLNVSRAADAAGCHRRTLYRMILRHGLDLAKLREDHAGRLDQQAEADDAR